jgi:hypothetical protein
VTDQSFLMAADALLLIHALVVMFVVLGLLSIIVGIGRQQQWVRTWRLFRSLHLAAVACIVMQSWLGAACPLTLWEDSIRRAAGQGGYPDYFVAYWVQYFLYYDFPSWVFTTAYTIFGLATLLTWIVAPPRRS